MFKHFPFIHNHGDFVHLDALRDWLRGVVSLESFLKSKNDKAIVKDMHFTDERTTVDYIDTKDDKEKTETLCEYLTSDVYDSDNKTVYNKVKKIRFSKDNLNENYIDVEEKSNGKERKSVIKSYVPVVYPSDSTKKYNEVTSTCSHVGFSPYGVYLYNDKNLTITQKFQFTRLIAYPAGSIYAEAPTTDLISNVGVSEDGVYLYHQDKTLFKKIPFCSTKTLVDCDPFNIITNQKTNEITQLVKTGDFVGTCVGNVIIGGQISYRVVTPITIDAGKSVFFEVSPKTMGVGNFNSNVYLKNIQCMNYNGIINSISKKPNLPLDNTTPVYITLYNSTDTLATINEFRFTF